MQYLKPIAGHILERADYAHTLYCQVDVLGTMIVYYLLMGT
jgi:hypothetical protein